MGNEKSLVRDVTTLQKEDTRSGSLFIPILTFGSHLHLLRRERLTINWL